MWHELIEELDLDVGDGPDLAGSIFVGDAGGRQATNGGKGDHSCSDRCVAYPSTTCDIALWWKTLITKQGLRCQCWNRLQDP